MNGKVKTGVCLGLPSSWNQLKQSGFPLDDYDKEMPIGKYEVIVDDVCYAKSSSRIGTGIHVFAGFVRESIGSLSITYPDMLPICEPKT
jgi:hypothetical protein